MDCRVRTIFVTVLEFAHFLRICESVTRPQETEHVLSCANAAEPESR
jgi:hypothetical protein